MTIHTLLSFHPSRKKKKKRKDGNFPLSSFLSWKGHCQLPVQAQLGRHHLSFLPVRIISVFLVKVLHNHLRFHPVSNKSAQGCRHTHTETGAEQEPVLVLLVMASKAPLSDGQISLSHGNAKYYLHSKNNVRKKYLGDAVICFK